MSNFLMVAAIDFGTTYSGYAFSTISDFKHDPLKIHANQVWNAGARQLLSLKTPTCLLLDGRQQFVSFGYDAENAYTDLVMDDKHHDYYFFSRFKMRLYNVKKLTVKMELEDVTGKPLLAIDVFAMSIKALKSHMLKVLDKEGNTIEPHEIKWVLTVPAIWDDSAKLFMRKSAEKAGINHDQLCIALEPEVASIYCQHLPTEKLQGASKGFRGTGQTYMVVDLGGGTVDITVHKIKSNGRLKELCHASGGDCGGMSIDNAFIQIIVEIIGAPLVTLLKEEAPDAYLDILREFEIIKRKIETETTGKVNFTIPCATINSLCEEHQNEDLSSMIQSSPFGSKIELKRDKLRIDADVMKSLFEKTINNIISLVKDVLRKPAAKNVPLLLLVGGFAECPVVQSAMKTNFPDKRIIIPDEAVLSVLKGAVLFGHRPDYIASRVMRFSYGTDVTVLFDPDSHEQHRKYTVDGEDRCSDIFSEIIQKNESVAVGTMVDYNYTTDTEYQSKMYITIYGSNKEKATYVDDDGCFLIGRARIDIPSPTRKKRLVSVEYIFGNTEISILATDDLHGTTCKATFTLI